MNTPAVGGPISSPIRGLLLRGRRRLAVMWQALGRYPAVWPAIGLIAVATAGYWYTLSSLADYLRLDTPLAYLLLLPFFSLLVAGNTLLRHRGAPSPPRELQIDLLVGIPLMLTALLMLVVLPVLWSTYYWVERPDVLSLGLFLSGGIILLFGAGWFWRLRGAMLFIFHMWPGLYLNLLAGAMRSLTDVTNAALTLVAQHLPLGVTSTGGDVLSVQIDLRHTIDVSLTTACSGANGVLGVALVGGALSMLYVGRRGRKLMWLLSGMVLVFGFNIARIISILVLARNGHPDFALGGYHATIGLVLFVLTLILMMAVAPLFGLRLYMTTLQPAGRAERPQTSSRPSLRRSHVAIGAMIVALGGAALAADLDLGSYASFIDGTGVSRVHSFSPAAEVPAHWTALYQAEYLWAQQYFGANSTYKRYVLSYGTADTNRAWVDVVTTDDQGSLATYNLQSCFIYHNYLLHATRRVDVGHGVTALLINYSDPATNTEWVTVSWAWPVLHDDGTSYERIAITADLGHHAGSLPPAAEPAGGLRGTVLSILNGFGLGPQQDGSDAHYASTDNALQAIAGKFVDTALQRAAA